MWLRTELELSVSGKSREVILGSILPEGWQLSSVDSPIPVAVDTQGVLKAQVRAGKWSVMLSAFRNTEPAEIRYAENADRIVDEELIGFQSNPTIRTAELSGLTPIDVSQTTYPSRWRDTPVYRWDNQQPFQILEKLRGMGTQSPEGLSVSRTWWLDDDGQNFTFRDQLSGTMQQHWRLDVTEGQQLGAVRTSGQGQLITKNPATGASGIEVRQRNIDIVGIGRMDFQQTLPAVGWRADAKSLNLIMSLPPGWRMLALFGADRVEGDWLTAWSLLDLFLVLIFAIAVGRLWNWRAGLIALLAFGLTYHELGSPRFTWLMLLLPLALLRVIPSGTLHRIVTIWKWLAVLFLLFSLVPFVARQVNMALYPQLEAPGIQYSPRFGFWQGPSRISREQARQSVSDYAVPADEYSSAIESAIVGQTDKARRSKSIVVDPQAKIQTGPAQPDQLWNEVHCYWNGPVSPGQQIRPILLNRTAHRLLTVARVGLVLWLLGILLGAVEHFRAGRKRSLAATRTAVALGFVGLFATGSVARAQFPDDKMLSELRERVIEPSDAFPGAAEIAFASLELEGNDLTMQVEVHAAAPAAVPLPGRVPVWSPLSVTFADGSDVIVCRSDDYLWVTLPQGVHQVKIRGRLPEVNEWEWRFLLAPRRVLVTAPGWTVTGIGENGVPESQILFVQQQKTTAEKIAYDQRDYNPVVAIERTLEIGLEWKVHCVVRRLSGDGKALSFNIPLLANESVLTPGVSVQNGSVEARLPAGSGEFSWSSQLPIGKEIALSAAENVPWVERWMLTSAPIWNVELSGLSPVFARDDSELIPSWYPWPGEQAVLSFTRPETVPGETTTVHRVTQRTSLGDRERTTSLQLEVESSLGGDFNIELPESVEITNLVASEELIPVRIDGNQLAVPLRPGKQKIEVNWKSAQPLTTIVSMDSVKLPVMGANASSEVTVPENRIVLWADGPLIGPAVRIWTVLVVAVLVALALGQIPYSPLRTWEWLLLVVGLTQVHLAAAMIVVAWLFGLAWRGRMVPESTKPWRFNGLQLGLALLTVVTLGIFVVIVGEGLLGDPKLFIQGNNSSSTNLVGWLPERNQCLANRGLRFYLVLPAFDARLGPVAGRFPTALAELGL
jgi:hypothetical protein